MYKRYQALSYIAVSSIVMISCAEAQPLIGVTGPMTGPYAWIGDQMQTGAEMAVADINSSGGVLGQQIELNIYDDACDPRQAVSVAHQAADDGVIGVIGHFCSSATIAASEVYTEEGILYITPSNADPALTDNGGANIFRLYGRNDQQGSMAAEYISEVHPHANLAITHDGTPYGRLLAETAYDTLQRIGSSQSINFSADSDQTDTANIVSQMLSNGTEVVYFGGLPRAAADLVLQMHAQGLNADLITGDSVSSEEYWAVAGDNTSGTLFTAIADPIDAESSAHVIARFLDEGIEPSQISLYTYAAVEAWLHAATSSRSIDLREMISALRSSAIPTIVGEISFNDNGDLENSQYRWYMLAEDANILNCIGQRWTRNDDR